MRCYGGQEEGRGSFQEDKGFWSLKLYFYLLKIGAKPINVVYPLPLASFLAFSLSKSVLFEFFLSYVFCSLFFTALNLWNHVNDADDDAKDGRMDAIFLIKMKKEAIVFSVLLYFLSALMLIFSKELVSIPLFMICALMTWIYSDKFFFGKRFRRLKEDYKTEILTYLIVTPSFAMLLWTFFAPISVTAIVFTIIFALVYLSAIFLKDLKDVTADSLAGYRTLAVVFSPKKLFKTSALTMISTVLLIIALSLCGLLPLRSAFTAFVLIPIAYSIFSIRKNDWELSLETINAIRVYTLCFPITFALLAIFSIEL